MAVESSWPVSPPENCGCCILTYGLIGGAGLGLGYIVPVATLVKSFPDKRGMITGIAVAGFGAGALLTAPIANRLIGTVGVLNTFAILGIAYLIAMTIPALFMKDPPPVTSRPGGLLLQHRKSSGRARTSHCARRWVPGSAMRCGHCCF